MASDIERTENGDWIIIGDTESDQGDVQGTYPNHCSCGAPCLDMWVIKLNDQGDTLWTNILGRGGRDRGMDIELTNDGGYIATGFVGYDTANVCGQSFYLDYYVVKLDANGDTAWSHLLGGTRDDIPYSIEQTDDGGYIVGGSSESVDLDVNSPISSEGTDDIWLTKLDPSGNIEWERSLGGTSADVCVAIRPLPGQGYIMLGNTFSDDGYVNQSYSGNMGDYWLVKLNDSGDTVWTRTLGGSSNEVYGELTVLPDSTYAIAGLTTSDDHDIPNNEGGQDFFYVHVDEDGNKLQTRTYGGSGNEYCTGISLSPDGKDLLLTGPTYSTDGDLVGRSDSTTRDWWTIKINPSGDTLWTHVMGGGLNDDPKAIHPYQEGFAIAGWSESSDGGFNVQDYTGDLIFARILTDSSSTTSVPSKAQGDPKLTTIRPNPVQERAILDHHLNKSARIEVLLYDIQGKRVERYGLGERDKGEHHYRLDVSDLRTGIHFYELRTSNGTLSKGKFIKVDEVR